MVYTDIRVFACNNEDLQDFVELCSVIQSLGTAGKQHSFKVTVDGDGSGKYIFAIKRNNTLYEIPMADKSSKLDDIWLGE